MDTKREVNAVLEKKTSKNGNDYWSITISITPDYDMVAFPNKAESALLDSYQISRQVEKPLEFN